MACMRQTKKETGFDQKKKWEEYPATAGSEGGGTEGESQPVFQACCRADTSLPGTVTFGVVPLWLKIMYPKLLYNFTMSELEIETNGEICVGQVVLNVGVCT